jgi:hypothetical protein
MCEYLILMDIEPCDLQNFIISIVCDVYFLLVKSLSGCPCRKLFPFVLRSPRMERVMCHWSQRIDLRFRRGRRSRLWICGRLLLCLLVGLDGFCYSCEIRVLA